MAHTHAAVKALRQSKKNHEFNLLWKGRFKDLLKRSRKSIADKKLDEAKKLVADVIQTLDKAAQKRVIKKNSAARLKSRIMKRLNNAVK